MADILIANPEINRPALALLCDGGCDFSPKSNLMQFLLGRFWKEQLQVCPDNNPIDHLWAPCSKWLADVSFYSSVEGENIPPPYQTISATEGKSRKGLSLKRHCQI